MDATFDTICSVIISSFEDEETPQQIAEWSQAHAGKRITESNKPSDWYITKRYGWTILENEAYWRDRMGVKLPEQKFAFILARVDKGAVWPAGEALAAENSAYFSGAHERNARRRMELDRGDNITHAARAVDALRAALDDISSSLPYDFPDRYAVLAAMGLGDIRKAGGRVSL